MRLLLNRVSHRDVGEHLNLARLASGVANVLGERHGPTVEGPATGGAAKVRIIRRAADPADLDAESAREDGRAPAGIFYCRLHRPDLECRAIFDRVGDIRAKADVGEILRGGLCRAYYCVQRVDVLDLCLESDVAGELVVVALPGELDVIARYARRNESVNYWLQVGFGDRCHFLQILGRGTRYATSVRAGQYLAFGNRHWLGRRVAVEVEICDGAIRVRAGGAVALNRQSVCTALL